MPEINNFHSGSGLSDILIKLLDLLRGQIAGLILEVEHNVVRLEVSVQNLLLCQILESNHYLLDYKVHLALTQVPTSLNEVVQVGTVVIVHDNVVCTLRGHDVVDLNQVWML